MLIGYARPLQDDLKNEAQRRLLMEEDCERIIAEVHASAKKREELNELMKTLKPNDVVVVAKLYVLADSTHHLVELLDHIENRGAFLVSLQEGIDTRNRDGYSFRSIVKHLAAFQTDCISEKTKKGVSKAKKRGIQPGRPRKPDENVQQAIIMYKSNNYTLKEIREKTGISKSTLYRYLET